MGYLQQHLADLLPDHECIIVPELGGFVCHRVPAKLNQRSHTIHPPAYQVSFNARLFHNDGVFAQDLRLREGITYEEAITRIRSEVAWLQRQLDAGQQVQFERVGVLFKDKQGQLIFSPSAEENFLTASYGLTPVSLHPVEHSVGEVEEAGTTTPVVPLGTEEGAEVQSRVKRTLRNLAAAAVVPFMIAGVWLMQAPSGAASLSLVPLSGSASNASYMPRFEEEDFKLKAIQERSELDVQLETNALETFYYSFIDDEVSPHGVRIRLNAPTSPVNSQKLDLYFIVGGAFREKSNATDYVQELRTKGYDANIIGKKGDLHLVAFGSYADRTVASEALQKIRTNDNPQAWLKRK